MKNKLKKELFHAISSIKISIESIAEDIDKIEFSMDDYNRLYSYTIELSKTSDRLKQKISRNLKLL